jgi:hypothetical protein
MATLDECVAFTFTYDEALTEVAHFCICAVIGITCLHMLQLVVQRRKAAAPPPKQQQQAREEDKAVPFPPVALLPFDIAASIATFVNVVDIAALGVSNRSVRARCWEPHQVWTALAAQRRCCLNSVTVPSVLADHCSATLSEFFRRAYFHLDETKSRLSKAREGGGHDWPERVLEEARHMLCGLMPRDGEAVTAHLYEATEAAFHAHDVHSESALRAVEAFLSVARRRSDLLGHSQVRYLEEVLKTAHRLEATWGIAMKRFFANLPQVQAEARGYWEEDTSTSMDQAIDLQNDLQLLELEEAEYDAMHDAEREASEATV